MNCTGCMPERFDFLFFVLPCVMSICLRMASGLLQVCLN